MDEHAVPTKKPKAPPPKETGPVQLNLRVSPEVAEQLDEWVRSENEKRTWPQLTRTDVLRYILEQALRDRPKIP